MKPATGTLAAAPEQLPGPEPVGQPSPTPSLDAIPPGKKTSAMNSPATAAAPARAKAKSPKEHFPTRQVKPETLDKVIGLVINLNRDTLREPAKYQAAGKTDSATTQLQPIGNPQCPLSVRSSNPPPYAYRHPRRFPL